MSIFRRHDRTNPSTYRSLHWSHKTRSKFILAVRYLVEVFLGHSALTIRSQRESLPLNSSNVALVIVAGHTWNWLRYSLSVCTRSFFKWPRLVMCSGRLTVQSHRISLTLHKSLLLLLLVSKENNIDEACFRLRSHPPGETGHKWRGFRVKRSIIILTFLCCVQFCRPWLTCLGMEFCITHCLLVWQPTTG